MSIPMHYEIYKEVIQSLDDGNIHPIADIRDFVAKRRDISDEERSIVYESGSGSVFNSRVHWARKYLKASGLVSYPQKGFSQITDE